jgi:hypothetical protein
MEIHEGCEGIVITGSANITDNKLGVVRGGIVFTPHGTVKLYSRQEVEKGLPKLENPNT